MLRFISFALKTPFENSNGDPNVRLKREPVISFQMALKRGIKDCV